MNAIELRGLRKTYGAHAAVDGIDLTVQQGEVFALLGPNGAGKTTTVEILEATAGATTAKSVCWASTRRGRAGPGGRGSASSCRQPLTPPN